MRHPEESSENAEETEKTVLSLLNSQLHLSIRLSDISVAHWLKKKRGDNAPASIIIRFTNLKARNNVCHAHRGLKGCPMGKIFVNEYLTKSTSNLFRLARTLVKEKKLHAAWTTNGLLHVKRLDDQLCRPAKVSTEAELLSIV